MTHQSLSGGEDEPSRDGALAAITLAIAEVETARRVLKERCEQLAALLVEYDPRPAPPPTRRHPDNP